MANSLFSGISFQRVTQISAHTFPELESAPLIITINGDGVLDGGWADLTIHTNNRALTAALVEAINGAVASVGAKSEVIAA